MKRRKVVARVHEISVPLIGDFVFNVKKVSSSEAAVIISVPLIGDFVFNVYLIAIIAN